MDESSSAANEPERPSPQASSPWPQKTYWNNTMCILSVQSINRETFAKKVSLPNSVAAALTYDGGKSHASITIVHGPVTL